MSLAVQMCDHEPSEEILKLLPYAYLNDSIYDTMFNPQEFVDTYSICILFGESKDCKDILFPTFSEKGVCYSFNRINLREYFSDE